MNQKLSLLSKIKLFFRNKKNRKIEYALLFIIPLFIVISLIFSYHWVKKRRQKEGGIVPTSSIKKQIFKSPADMDIHVEPASIDIFFLEQLIDSGFIKQIGQVKESQQLEITLNSQGFLHATKDRKHPIDTTQRKGPHYLVDLRYETEVYKEEDRQRIYSKLQGAYQSQQIIYQSITNTQIKKIISFKDIIGLKEVKHECYEIIDFLKNPEKYKKMGAEVPRGILLYGPPGNGKTLIAKGIATDAGVPFIYANGSDFVKLFIGSGPERVRQFFNYTRKINGKCIIFIDEFDAVGTSRQNSHGHQETKNTLNAILAELDGFNSNPDVIVILATNYRDALDAAVLRPGRIDRQIAVPKPTLQDRIQQFQFHCKKKPIGQDVKFTALGKRTFGGFSAADIKNICNEAALNAARHGQDQIHMINFHEAIDRVIGGVKQRGRVSSNDEKRRVTYHESGHTLVGHFLAHAEPAVKVTIVPHGLHILGFRQHDQSSDMLDTEEKILDKICVSLGGQAAEEYILGNISSGAYNDLESATHLARVYVSQFGMGGSKLSLRGLKKNEVSEKTAQRIEQQVERILDEQYKRALLIIQKNEKKLHKLAQKLYAQEELEGDEINLILGKRDFSDKTINPPIKQRNRAQIKV